MRELARDVLILVGLLAPVVCFMAGRLVEHRRWARQRSMVYESLTIATRKLAETHVAEAQALDIVRAQRQVLETMTTAAEQLGDQPGPITEARHRLAWAAAKARSELL